MTIYLWLHHTYPKSSHPMCGYFALRIFYLCYSCLSSVHRQLLAEEKTDKCHGYQELP